MIYIVRHGQTAGNKANVLQGRGSNAPLNEKGIEQAGKVRDWFKDQGIRIDRVYTSPLIRAVQTAQIIAGEAERITDEHLLEMDYGPYEGMDLSNPAPEVTAFFADFVNHPAPEGMEPLAQVVRRLGEFLEGIREEAGQGKGNILLSTHAIAMKGALEYLTPGSDGRFWGTYIRNCALYEFEAAESGYTVPREVDL